MVALRAFEHFITPEFFLAEYIFRLSSDTHI